MRRRDFIAIFGAATTWPLAARAQQRAAPTIGYLSGGTESEERSYIPGFYRGLGEQGYVEGRNVEVLFRWADARLERLPALAADLAAHRVAVIATLGGTAAAVTAKSATATIPVVFAIGSDPIAMGLVASLSHPNGNVTGVTFLGQEVTAKRMELLHEIVPTAKLIGYLGNPTSPQTASQLLEAENAARTPAVHLAFRNASTPIEIDAAFAFFDDPVSMQFQAR